MALGILSVSDWSTPFCQTDGRKAICRRAAVSVKKSRQKTEQGRTHEEDSPCSASYVMGMLLLSLTGKSRGTSAAVQYDNEM